jgi:integrase
MTKEGGRRLRDGRVVAIGRNGGVRKICGCARRVRAKCPHPWHFNFKWNDRAYRFSLDREVGRRVVTKADATVEAERFRREIRAGTFRQQAVESPLVTTPDAVTFDAFSAVYFTQYVTGKRQKKSARSDASMLRRLSAFVVPGTGERIGARLVGALVDDDFASFLSDLATRQAAHSTHNHYVQVIRSMGRWGVKSRRLTHPWLVDADVRRRKCAQRQRRLHQGEEADLLAAAPPHLQRLIIAALESCCRLGELLNLRWRDVDMDRHQWTIRAEVCKTERPRTLPLSARLRAVLSMVARDPEGQPHPPAAFVFGNETGEAVACVRKSWDATVLRAHGTTPAYTPGTHALTLECRATLRAINLHFHDLRHEAASRYIEAGWPLHHVRDMLGHANLTQTSTYLNATSHGLQAAMKALDESRESTPDPSCCKPVASSSALEHPPVRNGSPGDARQVVVN